MKPIQALPIFIALSAMGQSFVIPGNPPKDIPVTAQKIVKKWHAALMKDDWKSVARIGSPFLSNKHTPKDGGKDFRFFKGYTYYAKYLVSPVSGQTAMDSIQNAYRELPDQGEICYQAGHLLLLRDHPKEAVKPLEDAVRLYPFPDARVDLAVALNGSGRHQEAYERLLILDRDFPKHRRIRFEMAHCLVSLKRPSEGLPILEELTLMDPKDIGAQKELAYVLTELERPKDAIPHLQTAAALVPKDPAPWVELAYAYLMLQQTKEAELAITEAKHRNASPELIKVMQHNLRVVKARK